jgi:hypothetical protein
MGTFLLDVLRTTVQAGLFSIRANLEAELRGDFHPRAKRSQRFTHQLFVRERTVHFRRIKKGDAAFDGGPDHRDHVLLFSRWTEAMAHAHAAEPKGRDFKVGFSKFSRLHFEILFLRLNDGAIHCARLQISCGRAISQGHSEHRPSREQIQIWVSLRRFPYFVIPRRARNPSGSSIAQILRFLARLGMTFLS